MERERERDRKREGDLYIFRLSTNFQSTSWLRQLIKSSDVNGRVVSQVLLNDELVLVYTEIPQNSSWLNDCFSKGWLAQGFEPRQPFGSHYCARSLPGKVCPMRSDLLCALKCASSNAGTLVEVDSAACPSGT